MSDPATAAAANNPLIIAVIAIFSSVSAFGLKIAEMYFTSKKRASGEEIDPAELKRNYDATHENYSQVSDSLKDLVRILANIKEMVTRNEVRLKSLEDRCSKLERDLDRLEGRFNRNIDSAGIIGGAIRSANRVLPSDRGEGAGSSRSTFTTDDVAGPGWRSLDSAGTG